MRVYAVASHYYSAKYVRSIAVVDATARFPTGIGHHRALVATTSCGCRVFAAAIITRPIPDRFRIQNPHADSKYLRDPTISPVPVPGTAAGPVSGPRDARCRQKGYHVRQLFTPPVSVCCVWVDSVITIRMHYYCICAYFFIFIIFLGRPSCDPISALAPYAATHTLTPVPGNARRVPLSVGRMSYVLFGVPVSE